MQNLLNQAFQLHAAGNVQEAKRIYLQILPLQEENEQLLFLLGTANFQTGNVIEAVSYLQKSLDKNATNHIAHSNLGLALQELKRLDEALASYDRAIALNREFPDAFNHKGNVLQKLKRLDEALASYDRAIVLKPDYDDAFNNRGVVLQNLKRFDEALASYDRAIALNPDYAVAFCNRGVVLQNLKRLDEALASYDRAIALNPDYADAFNNRGDALYDLKRLDEALASYDRAIILRPDYDFLLGKQQHLKMHLSIWNNFETEIKVLLNKIMQKEKVSTPFTLITLSDSLEILKLTSQIWVDEKAPALEVAIESSRALNNSKIKIGYFSADFHGHATMHLMAELFELHDKDQFEIIAFSFGPITHDAWELRAKKTFDQFIECHIKSDQEIASLSQNLGIDIAIDLKGFTTDSRPNIFAHRAAPIQVNFLGYPGTMGADYIDYLIADEVLIPKEFQSSYTEKIAYLPDCYQPNCSNKQISTKPVTRSTLGLPENAFVFCSLNSNYKITPQIFASWMRILKRVKGSVLWLLATNAIAEKNLRQHFEWHRIQSDRLVFAQPLPIEDHLNRICMADIMLDTFPCGAHTTCSDALRMGLPVITMIGNSFASRVAASILTALGLPELITHSSFEYEELAISLASDRKKMGEVRNKLRENITSTTLFDPQSFVRNLESLYIKMYDRKNQGLALDHIY